MSCSGRRVSRYEKYSFGFATSTCISELTGWRTLGNPWAGFWLLPVEVLIAPFVPDRTGVAKFTLSSIAVNIWFTLAAFCSIWDCLALFYSSCLYMREDWLSELSTSRFLFFSKLLCFPAVWCPLLGDGLRCGLLSLFFKLIFDGLLDLNVSWISGCLS